MKWNGGNCCFPMWFGEVAEGKLVDDEEESGKSHMGEGDDTFMKESGRWVVNMVD